MNETDRDMLKEMRGDIKKLLEQNSASKVNIKWLTWQVRFLFVSVVTIALKTIGVIK